MAIRQELQATKIGSYLIIVGISLIFILEFGPASRGCDKSIQGGENAAAFVNGKEIPLREFQMAYAQRLQAFRAQGNPIPESLARQVGIPQQVLEELVDVELLSQEAARQGIQPSDSELRELIRGNPDFQQDGKFDASRYQEVLSGYYRKTVPEFESDLRRRLAARKMLTLVDEGAIVSDDEVKARFLKDGNKADVTYVRFLPSMFADKVPAPSAAEVAAFKASHAKEIADDYEANKFVYQQPEKVRARHILVKVDRSASQTEKDAAKAKIEALRKEIVEGKKDFGEVAKESSDDTGSKASGGELGFNDRQSWVPEFSDAAFSLKPNEISAPVQTQFGFHLIQVEEKKPADNKSLAEVDEQIARQLVIKEKARELANAAARKALDELKAGKKLTELFAPEKDNQPAALRFETETKPEAVATGEFNAGADSLPHLGAAPEVMADVFAAKAPGPLPKVYAVGDARVIAEVTERKLPSETELASQKDKLRADAMRAKSMELRESFIKALKKTANVQTNSAAVDQTATRS